MPEGLPMALGGPKPSAPAPAPAPKAAAPAPAPAPAPKPSAPTQAPAPTGDSSMLPPREEQPVGPPVKPPDGTVPQDVERPGERKWKRDVDFEEGMYKELEQNQSGEDFDEFDKRIEAEGAGEGEAPPGEGGEPPADADQPPAPTTFKVGDREYTIEDIERIQKAEDDWKTYEQYMAQNPMLQKYWADGVMKYKRGELQAEMARQMQPQEQPKPQAPQAPQWQGPSDDDLLAQMPEDFRAAGKALLARNQQMMEHYQKALAEQGTRLKQYEEITQDNLLDKEWTDLQGWIKEKGYAPADEMRVIHESQSRGGISLKDAYLATYFDENMLRARQGKSGAAGAAQPPGASAPAANAAGANGNGQGAAKPQSRPIPRPANPARPTTPPSRSFGKMSGPESEKELLFRLRRLEKTGKW